MCATNINTSRAKASSFVPANFSLFSIRSGGSFSRLCALFLETFDVCNGISSGLNPFFCYQRVLGVLNTKEILHLWKYKSVFGVEY